MKLPQNKAARLAINVGFVVVWYFLWFPINKAIAYGVFYDQIWSSFGRILSLLVLLAPIVLATRYIWWGRIRPRPRITRSREQERAGKKWDAVVDELKNRK